MGRTISVGGSTVFQLNPDIPEAHKLRGWFDQGGNEAEVKELSNQMGGGGGPTQTAWKPLDELKDNQLGMGDKADYFSCKGIYLSVLLTSKFLYICYVQELMIHVLEHVRGMFSK